ncbi:MAG: response regulator transcription factor [Saprospiraceae bacterium]|nr:response regulator transcription factor [Saprospiraceae bacterium]
MIRVYIADDHQVLLDGLSTLLSNIDGLEVVGMGHHGNEVLHFLLENDVDVILLDINMPVLNGIETCKILQKEHPEIKVLALSMYEKASFIQQMLKNGAAGYILKNTGQDELVEAIKTVHRGEQYLSKIVSDTLMQSLMGKASTTRPYIPEMTRREKEVLVLIAKELTTQEISDQLHISLNTVETHRKNLLSKFGVRNSVGLIKMALERGLLE